MCITYNVIPSATILKIIYMKKQSNSAGFFLLTLFITHSSLIIISEVEDLFVAESLCYFFFLKKEQKHKVKSDCQVFTTNWCSHFIAEKLISSLTMGWYLPLLQQIWFPHSTPAASPPPRWHQHSHVRKKTKGRRWRKQTASRPFHWHSDKLHVWLLRVVWFQNPPPFGETLIDW